MSGPVLRFAPSPTGRLHIGNARSALLNGLVARREGGRFILRLDDTDRERSRQDFADAIVEDLGWLGLKPDLMVRQSDRFALYDAAADRLRAAGRLYPCYETEDELERRRRRQQARGLPPVYDRTALALTPAERTALEEQGRRPHWRFLLDHRIVRWRDGVRGECHVDCASLSDPVLVRADGSYLYTLPSVVDDIDLGVTLVVRGEDHVTNTAVQIQIVEALAGAAAVPRFAHHNLLTLPGGEGLSKRQGHLSLGALRDAGLDPLAVAAMAVLLGSSLAVRPVQSLEELAALIDLAHLSRAPARFDEADLAALNARLMHHLPYDAVATRLEDLGIPAGEPFWLAVRGNIATLAQAAQWAQVIVGPVEPAQGGDAGFLAEAARLLPAGPYDETSWGRWSDAVKQATGRQGRDLFMPLRRALTGLDHGPELKALLPLIGEARARARLEGRAA